MSEKHDIKFDTELGRMKYILSKYDIKTQQDFSDKYGNCTEFDATMARATVNRKFKKYGIVRDYEKNKYVYAGVVLRKPASEYDKLCNLLNSYFHEEIQFPEDLKTIWLKVDLGAEQIIASRITEHFKNENRNKVYVLLGYGCLYIKCIDNDTYDTLQKLLNENNKNI